MVILSDKKKQRKTLMDSDPVDSTEMTHKKEIHVFQKCASECGWPNDSTCERCQLMHENHCFSIDLSADQEDWVSKMLSSSTVYIFGRPVGTSELDRMFSNIYKRSKAIIDNVWSRYETVVPYEMVNIPIRSSIYINNLNGMLCSNITTYTPASFSNVSNNELVSQAEIIDPNVMVIGLEDSAWKKKLSTLPMDTSE